MSMLLMVQAMKTKVGNPLRKLVLIKLADNANDFGEAFPSYQHIADQCEIDRSTVRRHIKALEEAGFLRIEHREGPKGNSSNLYYLNLTPMGTEPTGVGTEPLPPVGTESTRTSHSSESVKEVLVHLNQMAGTSYRPVDSNLRLIEARLKEGATVADMKRVIDAKCVEWKGGSMEKYLRPQTLFNASKFEQYLGALGKAAVEQQDQFQPASRDWI